MFTRQTEQPYSALGAPGYEVASIRSCEPRRNAEFCSSWSLYLLSKHGHPACGCRAEQTPLESGPGHGARGSRSSPDQPQGQAGPSELLPSSCTEEETGKAA